MPSERLRNSMSSTVVIENLECTPKTSVKWREKEVMTSRQLKEMIEKKWRQDSKLHTSQYHNV